MKSKMNMTVKRLSHAIAAFKAVWGADFPHAHQNSGSTIIVSTPEPAITLSEAVRRGAWVEADEIGFISRHQQIRVRNKDTFTLTKGQA